MSYQNVSKPRSPWFYVGIGCAVLFFAGMIGCLALGTRVFNAAKEALSEAEKEAGKPLTPQQIAASLKGVPFYPESRLEQGTEYRALRTTVVVMKRLNLFTDAAVATLRTQDSPETVLSWYEKTLPANGYRLIKRESRETGGVTRISAQFQKGNDLVFVQVPERTQGSEGNSIFLLRFDNTRSGFRYE
ncbi:MAG: hypothetical protein SFU56_09000 [Capsulimonadales bacterium]|nr:hypothetical protein [Capsulimonadales bacterium]